jgi:CIC family chloride channel protein
VTGSARAVDGLRTSNGGLLALAILVGAGAGFGAVIFRWLIHTFTEFFTGYADYAGRGHVANPNFPALGIYFVLLTPVIAGILYGPLVYFFAREARGHGVPEVMYAVARRGGRIAPQVAAVKALASALCIGGGGSVGREGPIVQIGSALGSTLGRIVRVAELRMRVLVACGAAGGIAATFNAPLAGVFFAMELILRDFNTQSFGMVVLASVTASVIGRTILGDEPFLRLPAFHVDHLAQYVLFAVLGLLAGAVGVAFSKVLYLIEDACDWAWRGPEWLRPAVGGILLGGLLLLLPEMYGVGYPVLADGIAGKYAVGFLIVLLIGKMVACSLTIGIGGSGGVFAPSLFIGAMLGSAYGQLAHQAIPGIAGQAGVYGLIGMGAVFAGAARAPITAVIIMFELTGEYSIILPLMVAIVLATGVSHLITADTIYTLKLRRRGVNLDDAVGLIATTAGQVMEPVGIALDSHDSLTAAVAELVRSRHGQLPVIDAGGRYLGVVTAGAAADVLADGEHDDAAVAEAVEQIASVQTTTNLDDALTVLDSAVAAAVPVLAGTSGDRRLVGWLSHQQILRALARPTGTAGTAEAGVGDVDAAPRTGATAVPGEAGSSHA